MAGTVLILGASGRFGRAASQAFAEDGWDVRHFHRDQDTLLQAVQGVDLIVNGWNPLYPDWAKQVPQLHKRVIEAAKASGATVLIPGNVYVFGPDAPQPWARATPHLAQNSLGRIRIEMEEAYQRSGVKTIVLRAGDFLDTEQSGNWFDAVMTAKLSKGQFVYPGDPDIPHAWAYLPDLVRAAVALANQRSQLPTFCDVPFPGYTLTGRQMYAAINRVVGVPLTLRPMAWWPLQLASPFWAMGRCLLEMRYLWDLPHSLDDATLTELLPDFPTTSPETALASCLPSEMTVSETAIYSIDGNIDPDHPVAAGR